MKFTLILFTIAGLICHGGNTARAQKVFTEDIDRFWKAYDSIHMTTDSVEQVAIIQRQYITPGTPGLKAFMLARNYTAELWVKQIRAYPKFWNSIRPNTLVVKEKTAAIEASIRRLRELYPDLKEAKIYFTIGCLRSGGTTAGNMVLVGAEIATGDASTDVSEFSNNWLAGVFKEQSPDNIIALNIHEYVHTQQRGESSTLLAAAIHEGACDFITERVLGKPMTNNYITYGLQHEAALKEQFKAEMYTSSYSNWLYNGSSATTVADLGYFMGYTICKSYYAHASDKQQAIKDIITLKYDDNDKVEAFLARSGYYTEPLDKAALLAAFEQQQPVVVGMEPIHDKDSLADASLTRIQISFSEPMDTKGYSFNKLNKDMLYPITDVEGWSDNNTTLTLNIKLEPGKAYGFIISNRSLRSAKGYPLKKDYPVWFKTR